jgi:monovalent cation:proton antiporter-2 (CPA2) family protein
MAVSTSSVAGIVAGKNPLEYSVTTPYTLFLFQAIFIIMLCHLIHIPIKRIQQPKVIAEVIAGIILGPTVMGRIPNFTETCFPKSSLSGLILFANIGIILFLFIIGMEVDIQFIRKNYKIALSVGLINMAIPFGLGCAIAKSLYDHYSDEDQIKFTTFMVFIAVAMCITAFPVLVRILTELNLIGDRVGTVVLAAGITNDLTGWILLALAVTLANSSKPVNTVYILLLTVGWFLFLIYPVRIAMKFLLRKFTNDLTTGEPSQVSMMMILVTVFISAFYTDIIGVHAIFGAFMAGVIIPRENGYVIKITEKLEDLVHIVLIPIYFAITGLSVNLGLLNTGKDWGFTIGIIGLAMVGKIIGGMFGAKLNKFLWRESLAVGILMSCKGIVEIVVLTIGLNAGIINQRLYSMFIVMALVTTFATTPLALWCYPVEYREKRNRFIKGEINWDGTPRNLEPTESQEVEANESHVKPLNEYEIKELKNFKFTKLVLLLNNIDTISYQMAYINIFNHTKPRTEIKAIHLREFTSRTSHLLEASASTPFDGESEEDENEFINATNQFEYNNSSSLLSIIKSFCDMSGMVCTTKSVLSTFKNHIFAIHEQITDHSNLLITGIKLNQLSVDSQNLTLYKQLYRETKCHFGLLLINDRGSGKFGRDELVKNEKEPFLKAGSDPIPNIRVTTEPTTPNNELSPTSPGFLSPPAHSNHHSDSSDEDSKDSSSINIEDSTHKTLIDLKSINLVFNHNDMLSSSDLLSIKLIHKIISPSLANVNIFINAANSSLSTSDKFTKKITSLFKSKVPIVKVEIHFIKDDNFSCCIRKSSKHLENQLFVIANNGERIVAGSSANDKLFDTEVNELVNLSVTEGFHVLVVKSGTRT